MDASTALKRFPFLPSALAGPERLATFGLFALDGVGFGSWAAYLPTYKASLGLRDGQLSIALFAMVVGSMASMPLSGRVLAQRSTRVVVLAGASSFCLTIPLVAFAAVTFGSMAGFVLAALLFGATKGIIDVSANAHAIGVEHDGAGPLLSTCHGGWSLGVLCGATAVAGALKIGMPPLLATFLIAAALLGLTAAASRVLTETKPEAVADRPARSVWPRGRLIPLAALAFLGLFCEGAMGDWATIFLSDVARASASAAAMGFAAYSLVMMCGRFAGDRFVAKLGPVGLLASSGLSVALGLGLAVLFRGYWPTVAGFAFVGLGVSNMVPILFRAAGRDGDSGAAIASVSIVGYLGFLVGPPLIGALSQYVGLASALSVVILFGLTIAAGAKFVGDSTKPEIDLSKNPPERTTHVQCEPTL
ncbi:MFS transporter [Paludisphaera rhizosphaerae]|uniref:MFS transporter n=1 Tax=Paludisphaera rhizosphaerae TaxID=2711216 RepID=UPI0013EA82C1|nr:MFS transporter [Paludisphaera rhizosphaerae]